MSRYKFEIRSNEDEALPPDTVQDMLSEQLPNYNVVFLDEVDDE